MKSEEPRVAPCAQTDHSHLVVFSSRSMAFSFSELWRYRTLLYFLCWRDLKVRYKQTSLGASWALAQPIFTVVVFTVLFGKIAKIPSNGIPYSLFSLAALIPWMYVSTAVSRASLSVVSNGHLINKVYFPRIIIPITSVMPGAADFVIALAFLFCFMIYRGLFPSLLFLAILPLLFLWSATLALAISLWLSALHVRFRDIGHALPLCVQLWMYVTPVIFPQNYLPHKYQLLILVNPLSGVIETFRNSLFSLPIDTAGVMLSIIQTLLLLITGILFFQKKAETFADIV